MNGLAGFDAVKADKPAAVAAAADQPRAGRIERLMFDESLKLVVDDFMDSLAGLPIEDLSPSVRFEMVDVPDLAGAADRQQFGVGRKRQRPNAAD